MLLILTIITDHLCLSMLSLAVCKANCPMWGQSTLFSTCHDVCIQIIFFNLFLVEDSLELEEENESMLVSLAMKWKDNVELHLVVLKVDY